MSSRRPDSSLAAVLLAQRLVDSPADPLKASEFWSVIDSVQDPGRLLGLDADGVQAAGVTPALAGRVVQRMEAATALAFELERLAQGGVRVLSAVDDAYPARLRERLGRGAPPVLYAAGPTEVLAQDGVGVVGSRHATPDALEVARRVAEETASRGLPLVSGGARGIDATSMAAALAAGGTAVGVLADSLVRQLRHPDARRAILDGRLCLCTPYQPTAGFSVANATGRNRIIYALTSVTLVVTSEADSGGTWAGAVEALRSRITDVAVWDGPGAGPGNPALAARGARAVTSTEMLHDGPDPTPGSDGGDDRTQLKLDL